MELLSVLRFEKLVQSFKFRILLRELLLDDPLAIFDAQSKSPRAHALLVANDVHLKFGQGTTLGRAF